MKLIHYYQNCLESSRCSVKRDVGKMNIHATQEDQSEVKARATLTTEQKQHSGQEEQQVGSCQHTDEAQHSSDKQHDHTERQQDDERSLHVWKEKRTGCVSAEAC